VRRLTSKFQRAVPPNSAQKNLTKYGRCTTRNLYICSGIIIVLKITLLINSVSAFTNFVVCNSKARQKKQTKSYFLIIIKKRQIHVCYMAVYMSRSLSTDAIRWSAY